MPAPAAQPRPRKPDESSSSSYILLVQHLIEKCLLFNMDQRECVEALSKHANILPVITITVWNELEKENKEFFSSSSRNMEKRKGENDCRQAAPEQMLEDAAAQVRHQRLDQDRSDSDNVPRACRFSHLCRRVSSGGLLNVNSGNLYLSLPVGVSGSGEMHAFFRIPKNQSSPFSFTYRRC